MTVIEHLKKFLISNGMFENQASIVMENFIKGEFTTSMSSRWNEEVCNYPEILIGITEEILRTYGLKYIDKHAPKAWFRPVFLPVTEREKFLTDCN